MTLEDLSLALFAMTLQDFSKQWELSEMECILYNVYNKINIVTLSNKADQQIS
jgi:hypothetical protein